MDNLMAEAHLFQQQIVFLNVEFVKWTALINNVS